MARAAAGARERGLPCAFRAVVQGGLWRPPAPLSAHAPARAGRGLLRDTELSITEIAFETGWQSLGTFGRTFRDVKGESPGELRAREKAAMHALERVPHCFVAAAQRPDLTMAVSEKRRQEGEAISGTEETDET